MRYTSTYDRLHSVPLRKPVLALRDAREKDVVLKNLVHTHGKRLHRFLTNSIGSRDEANDIAQQAFMEAVRSYETYNGQSELSTWLYGIAMNLVRNHLSRSPTRKYEFVNEATLAHIPSPTLPPAEAAEQAQHMRHLDEAFSELNPDMRDVLTLVVVDELTYEQAATRLAIPVGTVRSRVSRARVLLKSKLQERGVVLDFF